MPDSFYRSGQAAKQLGVSSYHIRRLCEVGEITAELTAGQQWRIPASEIARLRREGVPDIPVESDAGDDDSTNASSETDPDELPDGLLAAPSVELIEAAEEVKIVESRLKKRRVERESEELEDWFRDRDRQQAEREATARQKTEAARAEQRRREWFDSWIQYALRSRPHDAPREIELEIHQAVQAALASLHPDQPRCTTQRLVDAAVEKVLRPWKRKKEIRSAIESSISRLPWDIAYGPEWAPVKQRALDAAAAAVGKLPADATGSEMQEAAWLAVQPMVREYEHEQACRRIVRRVTVFNATSEEEDEAKEAVRKALAVLPIGATQKELEKAEETALAPYKAALARRQEEARLESERRARRRDAEWKVDLQLGHIERYLKEEYDYDGDYQEMRRDADRLRPLVRAALIDVFMENPDMSNDDIRNSIEDEIEDRL